MVGRNVPTCTPWEETELGMDRMPDRSRFRSPQKEPVSPRKLSGRLQTDVDLMKDVESSRVVRVRQGEFGEVTCKKQMWVTMPDATIGISQ
jgi:hypothetical protein